MRLKFLVFNEADYTSLFKKKKSLHININHTYPASFANISPANDIMRLRNASMRR